MRGTRQLSFRVRALAFLMRRMPTRIRKFAWWWDRMYRFIGAGGFEDDEAIAAHWPDGLQGPIWSRRFGYRLYLDLRSFAERRTYFSGAGSQEVLEDLFPLILRQGISTSTSGQTLVSSRSWQVRLLVVRGEVLRSSRIPKSSPD